MNGPCLLRETAVQETKVLKKNDQRRFYMIHLLIAYKWGACVCTQAWKHVGMRRPGVDGSTLSPSLFILDIKAGSLT